MTWVGHAQVGDAVGVTDRGFVVAVAVVAHAAHQYVAIEREDVAVGGSQGGDEPLGHAAQQGVDVGGGGRQATHLGEFVEGLVAALDLLEEGGVLEGAAHDLADLAHEAESRRGSRAARSRRAREGR